MFTVIYTVVARSSSGGRRCDTLRTSGFMNDVDTGIYRWDLTPLLRRTGCLVS